MKSLTAARELDSWGLNVVPAAQKAPIVPWQPYMQQRTQGLLAQWFSDEHDLNLWVVCGRVSQTVVLDVDSPEAEAWWRDRLGPLLDLTTCSQTRKGFHYWFSIEPNDLVPSWSWADEATDVRFDVRAEGTGVIAPPSIHETGHVYEWLRDPTHRQPLPQMLRSARDAGLQTAGDTTNLRSMLAQLLANLPPTGGRNVWLSRVAGHYAKQHRNMQDLYNIECKRANDMLQEPLGLVEFTKTVESIWRAEQTKLEKTGQEASEDNGHLLSGGYHLTTPVRFKQGEEWVVELRQWANFDLRALGVVEDEDVERTYDVQVWRKRQQDVINAMLPARVLSDPRRLDGWLAEFGVGITPPPERELTKTRATVRLQAYLEAQSPPHFAVVSALGWHNDGFVCHEGVIRADGLHGFAGVKPDPILRNRAPYTYGFMAQAEVRRVLQEVLTFHYTEVASVFGAWWAACLLKPQLQQVSSQFPFMALEAPSESGKTTGMFSKLIQLNGNHQGQTSYTPASLRNAIAAHQSGTVWIDDEDSLDHLMQLLRMATGEGSYTKMGEDHHSAVTVKLVAPILISGEALQMGDQKALRDRAVLLSVPTPTSRRSLHDPSRPQWDDIVALNLKYPDLTVMAGTCVQMALEQAHYVNELASLRGASSKRFGDKIAILRVGARILAGMTQNPGHVDTVDQWVDTQFDLGSENTLTLKILPEALQVLGWPDRVDPPYQGWPATPVFVRSESDRLDGVWFSAAHLAIWWSQHQRGRVEARTETRAALQQQARALGLPLSGGITRARIAGMNNTRPSYWRLPDDVGAAVLARSRGDSDRDSL